ncbi:MAG: pilus assembly protein PilZ [Burkholderiales bacterium]|jgi:type IV pilus assembly protein PilZ|nr:pilus assembly protein PilZ [Burkholderiales bacterium]
MATPNGATSSGASTARPSVIQLAIKEKPALYAAFIPFLTEGGIFIPTTRDYRLGDDVYLLLTIMDNPQRFPVAGKVAWITPANAAGNKTQGIGVRFPADEKARQLRLVIEEILGPTAEIASRATHTL